MGKRLLAVFFNQSNLQYYWKKNIFGACHFSNFKDTIYFRANAVYDSATDEYLPERIERTQVGFWDKFPLITDQFIDRYGQVKRIVAKTGNEEESRTTTFTHNAFGQVVTKEEESNLSPEKKTWTYQFDLREKLIDLVDPEGNHNEYDYDSLGNLVEVTENETNTASYTYNALSWKLSERNVGSAKEHTYVYDKVGQVKTYKDKNDFTYAYTYTPFYELDTLKVKNASGAIQYEESNTYDPTSRLLTSQTNATDNHIISYTYDNFNRMDKFTIKDREYRLQYQNHPGQHKPK